MTYYKDATENGQLERCQTVLCALAGYHRGNQIDGDVVDIDAALNALMLAFNLMN